MECTTEIPVRISGPVDRNQVSSPESWFGKFMNRVSVVGHRISEILYDPYVWMN